tara:strand:- start:1359 stop:1976 length:618 start_codon:yes stop_codon:yes gene_type:complete
MVKKALIIVQGINTQREYMKPTLKLVKKFFNRYDAIEYTHTEDIFDGTITAKFVDQADFIPYFFRGKKRKEVCKLVNEKIATLSALGFEVDVLAHSLGCIIALQSGRKLIPLNVNRMITLQSPIHNWVYGWYVRMKVRKHSGGLTVTNFITTWNPNDKLVAGGDLNIDRFIKSLKTIILSWLQQKVGKGHDWQLALVDLIKKGLV